MRYIILFCFVFSSISLADDPYFAQKGSVLPADSWVFSPEKTKETRDKLIDLDTNIKLNESLSKTVETYKANEEIQNNKVNLLLDQNDRLAKSLTAEKTVSNFEHILWFGAGILATVLAGIAIKEAAK